MKAIIVNCFDTYENRVLLIQEYFQSNGYEVVVVASNYRHFKKKFREDVPAGFVFVPARRYKKNLSIGRLISHLCFAKDALKEVEELCPDLLWVLAPPNSLVKEAALYKSTHKETRLIIDIIDMWPETMPISRFKKLLPFSAWQKLRDKYINVADQVVTECGLYQSTISKVCSNDKITTLYLAKLESCIRSEPNPPNDRFALCYLGSINNIIDISCISDIIRGLPDRDNKPILHIVGDGEQRELLIDSARETGAEVIYHGNIYETQEKQQVFDNCHFGLNIMKSNVFVGLTMKSMDYFESGLPIINNIRGDTWTLVDTYHIGINYENASSFSLENIDKIYEDRENVRKLFKEMFSVGAFNKKMNQIIANINQMD